MMNNVPITWKVEGLHLTPLASYQPGLSVMVQYFSFTTNQRTVLFSLAFQRSE
jgi:hypothetical protein